MLTTISLGLTEPTSACCLMAQSCRSVCCLYLTLYSGVLTFSLEISGRISSIVGC